MALRFERAFNDRGCAPLLPPGIGRTKLTIFYFKIKIRGPGSECRTSLYVAMYGGNENSHCLRALARRRR